MTNGIAQKEKNGDFVVGPAWTNRLEYRRPLSGPGGSALNATGIEEAGHGAAALWGFPWT